MFYEGHELRVFGVAAHLASFMAKYKSNTKVEVTDGPHKGKKGVVLLTTGRNCLVRLNQGTYNIAEFHLKET